MVREARFAWDPDRPLPPDIDRNVPWNDDDSEPPPVRRKRKPRPSGQRDESPPDARE